MRASHPKGPSGDLHLRQRSIQHRFHFMDSTLNGQVVGVAQVTHSLGFVASKAEFEGASFVIEAFFGSVFVAEVEFEPGNMRTVSLEFVAEQGRQFGVVIFVDGDVFVRIDLNEHKRWFNVF